MRNVRLSDKYVGSGSTLSILSEKYVDIVISSEKEKDEDRSFYFFLKGMHKSSQAGVSAATLSYPLQP